MNCEFLMAVYWYRNTKTRLCS